MDTYRAVRDFEAALSDYTGARYAVSTTSCTMALLLAVAYCFTDKRIGTYTVSIPKRTYCSVPMSVLHAGGLVEFREDSWIGWYRLAPLEVWDSARYFSSGMYRNDGPVRLEGRPNNCGGMLCVSFHASKTLGDTQGGAILLDDPEAAAWLRRARFDGRTEGVEPKEDTFTQIGWHCMMTPDVAARLLLKLSTLPLHNAPLPNSDYPDLSTMSIFK